MTGINPTVDSGLPDAFPTFLNFVGVSGSFDMVPLDTTVPEPSALLVAAAPLALLMLRRRRKS